MQFTGRVDRAGVHLQAILVHRVDKHFGPEPHQVYQTTEDNEEHLFDCPKCQKKHPRIFTFVRKPAGMMGCWVVFRYNGEEQVPDLSCPISLEKLPRDARAMTDEESAEAWHK